MESKGRTKNEWTRKAFVMNSLQSNLITIAPIAPRKNMSNRGIRTSLAEDVPTTISVSVRSAVLRAMSIATTAMRNRLNRASL
ncbi:hypothetical protein [Bradyrhizobium sp. Tv2a-2]|uniref:hypothetical protein n=1 Tax=Bradyrhizobium sp. Tv2a-2 TaxID=113395 RepID=UPI0012EC3C32|nr:hypothetical protein [Bradyrhizobium sp. Tv2a-2]